MINSLNRIVFSFFLSLRDSKSAPTTSNPFSDFINYRSHFPSPHGEPSAHFDPFKLVELSRTDLEKYVETLIKQKEYQSKKEIIQKTKAEAFQGFDRLSQSFSSKNYLEQYKKQFVEREFETEFFGNFVPIGSKDCLSSVSLSCPNSLFSCHFLNGVVQNGKDGYIQTGTSFPTKVYFIGDAEATVTAFLSASSNRTYVADELSFNFLSRREESLSSWEKSDVNIQSHSDKLVSDMLGIKDNLLEKAANRTDTLTLLDEINHIYDVSYTEKKDRYLLKKSGLDLRSQPTGSKLFFILSYLLSNGLIDSETVLIFDEPEVHLHPDWQNKLAELMVLLNKDLGAKILLTTHSPHFVLALDTFERKYAIRNACRFYYGAKGPNATNFSDYSDNINPIFERLFKPFVEIEGEHESLLAKKE